MSGGTKGTPMTALSILERDANNFLDTTRGQEFARSLVMGVKVEEMSRVAMVYALAIAWDLLRGWQTLSASTPPFRDEEPD